MFVLVKSICAFLSRMTERRGVVPRNGGASRAISSVDLVVGALLFSVYEGRQRVNRQCAANWF